jgi:hypothetical protein
VIGPGGVVVVDSKQHRGRLWLDSYGLLWHGRQLLISTLRKVRWEADQADEVLGVADVQVAAIVAVHGASVPWGRLQADGVTVAPPGGCPTCSGRCHRSLGLSGWPGWPIGPGCASVPLRDRWTATACWSPSMAAARVAGGGLFSQLQRGEPYVDPYALGVRTPGFGGRGCLSSSTSPCTPSRSAKPVTRELDAPITCASSARARPQPRPAGR